VKISLANWLLNAGIVGFLRIMDWSKFDIELIKQGNYIYIEAKYLEGFEDRYFKFLLNHFSPQFFNLKKEIVKNIKDRSLIEQYISQVKNISGTSSYDEYKAKLLTIIHKFKDEAIKSVENEKNLQIDKLEQSKVNATYKELKKIEKNIKGIATQYQKTIDSLRVKYEGDGKKEKSIDDKILSLGSIVMYLKGFYSNLAVIGNPSGSSNRIKDFKDVYVTPAQQALLNQHKDGITCKCCKSNTVIQEYNSISDNKKKPRMLDHVFNEGLFSISGVSLEGFKNFFFNFIPDVFVCPVCKLLILCAYAGFTEKQYYSLDSDETDRIFINAPALQSLITANKHLAILYRKQEKDSIYESIISELVTKEGVEKASWVLQNLFFVEIKPGANKPQDPRFKYFHIPKDIAELLVESQTRYELSRVYGQVEIVKKKAKVNLKIETIKRLFMNENLYFLVGVAFKNGLYYPAFHIAVIQSLRRQLINKYLGENYMESKQVYGVLRKFYEKGKNDFPTKNSDDLKRKERQAYRLLSLIRMGKYADFYEQIMKLYINTNKPIGEDLIGLLNTESLIDFEAMAYAFMSGYLYYEQPKEKKEESDE